MALLDAPQVGDDAGIRGFLKRLDELETRLQQVAAAAAGNASQVDFLAGQTVSAEAAPGAVTTITTNPATASIPDTWLPFNAAADASRTFTTSSTGRVAVQAGGYLYLGAVNFATQHGFIGIEILAADGVTQVRPPHSGDGNWCSIWGASNAALNASSGHRHEWDLDPNTTYTMRCRRGYAVQAGNAGATATVAFQGTAISVTKIGM